MKDLNHLERELESQNRAVSLLLRTLTAAGQELVHIDGAALEELDELFQTAPLAEQLVRGGVRA